MTNHKTTLSTDNNKRTISVSASNRKIIFTYKNDNISEYLTYDDTLYSILMFDCLKINRGTGGRLGITVRHDGRDIYFKLYDLALACYMGFVCVDTYLEDMERFIAYKRHKGLTVDHLDNDIHNNTVYNLSLMVDKLNKQKGEIVSWFKPPFALNSAYFNGEYRVKFEAAISQYDTAIQLAASGIRVNCTEGCTASMHFVCKDADEYVRCLKHLFDCNFTFMTNAGTPRQQWQEDKNQISLISDKMQEELALMDSDCFQDFSEIKTPC